jgi:hypothetical protein
MKFRLALVLCLAAGAARAACVSPDVTGLYDGSTTTSDGSKFEVTLNLLCQGGKPAAEFFTSIGDFTSSDVAAEGEGVKIGFLAFGARAKLDLTRTKEGLSGAFELSGDKGTAGFVRTGEALAADAMVPRLDLTPAEWHEDLAFFARELPKHHANAFFSLSRAAFEAEVAGLDKRIDRANGDEMFVGLQAIAKSIGDGHTGMVAPADRRVIPIQVQKFGGEFRVVAAGPAAAKALGTRIVRIGRVRMADAWHRVMALTPQGELDQLRREDALVYLTRGYALHGLDITPSRDHAVYTFVPDSGEAFDLDIAAVPAGSDPAMTGLVAERELRNQNKDAPFWCKDIGQKTVYCGWRTYQDLDVHAKEMFALAAKADKLVIDMRDNGGGDNTVGYSQIVKPLKDDARLNRKGRLYVLIGAETFSAAMNNAAQFQDETNAILAGETIGEKPNSYQEPRQFRLPRSHLVVRASTLWYAFRKTGPNVVAPDKEIVPSWDEVKAGRDPVLEWVLAQKP